MLDGKIIQIKLKLLDFGTYAHIKTEYMPFHSFYTMQNTPPSVV